MKRSKVSTARLCEHVAHSGRPLSVKVPDCIWREAALPQMPSKHRACTPMPLLSIHSTLPTAVHGHPHPNQ